MYGVDSRGTCDDDGGGGALKKPLLDTWKEAEPGKGRGVVVEKNITQREEHDKREEKKEMVDNNEDVVVISCQGRNGEEGGEGGGGDDNGTTETGAVVLLTLTAMGAGILSLPVTLYYGGWILGLLIIVGFAGLADYSLVVIVRSSNITKKKTIPAMAAALYGKRGEVLVSCVTLLLLIFAQIAMLIVIGDVLTPSLQFFTSGGDVYKASCDDDGAGSHCHPTLWAGTTRCDESCTLPPWWSSRLAVSVLATLIYYPLSLFEQLNALSQTSTAAVVAILGVIVALCVELGLKGAAPASSFTAINGSWRIMMIPSILSCAFCCHFNVLEVRDEMRPSVKHHIERVVHKTILGVVLVTYSLCAIVGYVIFGDSLSDCSDILTCFDASDKLMLVCSLTIGLVNVVKMPLIMLPTRALILELFDHFIAKGRADGEAGKSTCRRFLHGAHGRACLMFVLCSTNLVLALVMHDLTIGFSVIACTSGMAVCFIIPGALYDAAIVSQSKARGENPPAVALRGPRFGPIALLTFGVVSALVAFAGVVLFVIFE